MHFNIMFLTDVLAAFTHSFNIQHHHLGLLAAKTCVILSVAKILVGSVSLRGYPHCQIASINLCE